MFYQVIERSPNGVEELVRYANRPLDRLKKEEAEVAAIEYLTEVNCNNALTKDSKKAASESFMVTSDGILLGILDREPWFMTDRNNAVVKDKTYYELEDKSEIVVKPVPGT